MGLIKQKGAVKINKNIWHADVYVAKLGMGLKILNIFDDMRLMGKNTNSSEISKKLTELNNLIRFKEKGITGNRYEDVREDAEKLLQKLLHSRAEYVIIGLWKETPTTPDPLECECLIGINSHGYITVIENIF